MSERGAHTIQTVYALVNLCLIRVDSAGTGSS